MITLDKKKPTRAADDDAKFEAFLKKQFAELRAELDSQIAQSSAKAGQVVPFSPRITSWAKRNAKWKYSIAAAVIVAVAVPMVLQLNRQKAELARQSSAPTLEQAQRNSKTLQDRVADREEAEKDADAPLPAGNAQSKENYYTRKKSAPAKDARVIDDLKGNREKQAEIPRQPAELAAGRSEGYLSKEETNSAESAKLKNAPASAPSGGEQVAASRDKSERSVSAGAPAPAAPAAAAPEQAPVFAAKKRSAARLAATASSDKQ